MKNINGQVKKTTKQEEEQIVKAWEKIGSLKTLRNFLPFNILTLKDVLTRRGIDYTRKPLKSLGLIRRRQMACFDW